MLICRTPLRISIGGGGTDLPSYYQRYGGFVISAAINQYIFIGINRIFTNDYVIKYSALERVQTVQEIQHPIIREALQMHQVGPNVEIVSLADIPAGTGLGSSGSFTVSLVRALYAFQHEYASAETVAEEACHIEMERLGQAVGKQDQYVASFGGLICMTIDPGGKVKVSPLKIPKPALRELEDRLLMFFTGYSRSSGELLSDQKKRTETGDSAMIDNLHFVKDLGMRIQVALEAGDFDRFGELMHEHWLHKKRRTEGMSNPCIDHWYNVGRANGAIGGKLIGAGGGGFLMFYTTDPGALRQAMARERLQEVRFHFDHDGSTVICRD
jgi:D-glycero-alpha-D-manno-heptose-7-phosphate kinase